MTADVNGLTIGVVGAGAMGRGIAQVAACGGMKVRLFDANGEAVNQAAGFIAGMIGRLAEKGKMLPLGTCPGVGLSGYLLGGGYGLVSRALGLGCDSVLDATVVWEPYSLPRSNFLCHSGRPNEHFPCTVSLLFVYP